MEMILPDFKRLAPKKLIKLSEGIDDQLYEFSNINIDISVIFDKLRSNKSLNIDEIYAVTCELEKLIQINLLDKYFHQLNIKIKKTSIRKRRSILRQLYLEFEYLYFDKNVYRYVSEVINSTFPAKISE